MHSESQMSDSLLRNSQDNIYSSSKFDYDEENLLLKDESQQKSRWRQFLHQNCTKDKIWFAIRVALLVLVVIGISVLVGLLLFSDDLEVGFVEVLEWLEERPKWLSGTLLALIYAVALVFFCPGTPFNLAAGFMFGVWIGSIVAVLGCVAGSIIAFICGKTIARDWVKAKMESRPLFRNVDRAIQKQGIYIVFLTRLSPLFPFPLLNYAFGITRIVFWQYLLGTTLGVLPATVAYTYLGTLMRNITDLWGSSGENSLTSNLIYFLGGGILTIVSIVVISLITKRAITKATAEFEESNEKEQEPILMIKSTSSSSLSPSSLVSDTMLDMETIKEGKI